MSENSESPIWTACLAAFARELTAQQFATWIRPLSAATADRTLTVSAPNRFVLQWVKERFAARIGALAAAAEDGPWTLEFAIADPAPSTEVVPVSVPSTVDALASEAGSTTKAAATTTAGASRRNRDGLITPHPGPS